MKKHNTLLLLSTVAILALTACGKKETETPKKAITINDVTEFDEPVSLYTDLQKQFFAIEGEEALQKLSTAEMKAIADGSKNLSSPLPVKLEWNHEPSDGFEGYKVLVSKTEDMQDAREYDAGKNNKLEIYNLELGTTYYYQIKGNYADDTTVADGYEISATYPLEIEEGPIRNFYIDGITNCRDLGGKELAGGGRFKYNQVYRTSGFYGWDNGSAVISSKGREQVKQDMPFKTEIELRGGANGTGGEAKKTDASELENVNFKYVPWAYEGGKNLIYRNIEPLRKAFDVLGDPDNYPIDFHCRIGTDRTGAVALLLNGLVGVSIEDIYRDYLFSNFGQINTNSNPRTIGTTDDDNVFTYINTIKKYPGEYFHNKVYNFLATLGIPTEKLDNIIDQVTEGDKVTNDRTIKTVSAAEFESAQTKTNSTETRQPATSIKLTASGQKVSYTFSSDKDVSSAELWVELNARNTSLKLSTAIKVTLDGNEVSFGSNDKSFATKDLGFGTNNDFWQSAKVGDVALASGSHTIEIERIGSADISIGQITLAMDGEVELA